MITFWDRFLCVAAGFGITKAGLFPPVAARAAGQIILNVTLPSLVFSRIVRAFHASNVGALGKSSRHGRTVVRSDRYRDIVDDQASVLGSSPLSIRDLGGGWGNVGDIPTSVIMSLTAGAPFHGTSDQNLAIAYISVFVLVFFITLFPLGGANWVWMDFQGLDMTDEGVQEQLRIKQRYFGAVFERAIVLLKGLFYQRRRQADLENTGHDDDKVASLRRLPDLPSLSLGSRSDDNTCVGTTIVRHDAEDAHAQTNTKPAPPLARQLARFATSFFKTLVTPCSLAILMAFIIAVVPVLQALFVSDVVPDPRVSIPRAPDGQPPLAILLDTATFVGDASVPLGLMTLGSALARMAIPGGRSGWRTLPLGAVGALAVARMAVMPVFGVLVTQGLTHAGMLDASDHVLRFVCIFLSCLPTATTQVWLTQVYSGTGEAQHLSVFLIPQYILMFVTMTALTAYTLHLLFG